MGGRSPRVEQDDNLTINKRVYDRSEAFLQRWHAEPTIKTESLAEHQFFVAKNTLFICRLLKHYGIHGDFNQDIAVEIALQHDTLELITGDVSGPAKREYPELKEVLTSIEEHANKNAYSDLPESVGLHYRWIGHWGQDIERIETQIVKYCDVLAAAAFINSERQFGNAYMQGHEKRIKTWLAALDWPWLKQLRSKTYLP